MDRLDMDSVRRVRGGRCRPALATTAAVLACSLGACGSVANMMPDVGSFRLPDRSTFVPTRASVNYNISPTTQVGSADLVDAQGQCAAAPAAAEGTPRGVRLDMTECEVVRALGQPQDVQFTAPQGSDVRRVVLTYKTGDRPGIYEFTRGRLSGIERGADASPPPAKKPAGRKSQPPA